MLFFIPVFIMYIMYMYRIYLANLYNDMKEYYENIVYLHENTNYYTNDPFVVECYRTMNVMVNAQIEYLREKYFSNVKKVGKYYEITYTIGKNNYKMMIKPKKGPSPVINVLDADNKDITEEFLELAGPMYNFHGLEYTPEYFGTSKIMMLNNSGNIVEFSEKENIIL